MAITSIGDTLRRERQRRNLELGPIAAELRIAVRFLAAIEADDLSKLPGGVFTKSFIRQYASYLGMDGEELTAELKRTLEPEPPPAEVPDKDKPTVPGIPMGVSGEPWNSVRDGHGPWPAWLRSGLLLVALMLLCSAIYYWWQQRPKTPVQPAETARAVLPPQSTPEPPPQSTPADTGITPAPDASVTPDPSATPAGQAPSTPSVAQAGIPPATQPPAQAPVNTSLTPPSNPNAPVRVAITADEDVWLRAEANGKYIWSGTLKAHETRNFEADGEVRVRLGNAGGVQISLNGKALGAVGPKGQIRTVQFTSGGFQIVSPPKPPEVPLDRR